MLFHWVLKFSFTIPVGLYLIDWAVYYTSPQSFITTVSNYLTLGTSIEF